MLQVTSRIVGSWLGPVWSALTCDNGIAAELSTGWRGGLEVCSRSTTEEPHAAIVRPLLVRMPDG